MKKPFNSVRLAGYLYDHKLVEKVSGPTSKNPGTTFYTGTIDVATDDECLNIVTVHYSYVTATNAKGENPLFKTLANGDKTQDLGGNLSTTDFTSKIIENL